MTDETQSKGVKFSAVRVDVVFASWNIGLPTVDGEGDVFLG